MSRGGNKQGMGNGAVREVVEEEMSTRVVYTIRDGAGKGKGLTGNQTGWLGRQYDGRGQTTVGRHGE